MKKDYMAELENSGLLARTEMTQEEFRTELLQFQDLLCKLVLEDEEAHRIDEVICYLEKTAREKGMDHDPVFRKGMQALRRINKEIAISMSGKNGEERVSRTLEYITRPNYKFRNIYISDGTLETELDNVILTEAGFLILEVKNVKTDITISESGRILYSNEECYHDTSICEKMQNKRDLLKHELSKALEERGLHIPVRIDSLIVFSAPKGVYVRVTDLCRKERYCFRGKLPFIIDEYYSDGQYSDAELKELNTVMEEMKTHQKRFLVALDFNEIRTNIAAALTTCLGVPEPTVCPNVTSEEKNIRKESVEFEKPVPMVRQKKQRGYLRLANALAGSVASFVIVATGLVVSELAFRRA